MDGKDFAERLKRIKAEILALKQGHTYGVGSTNFVVYKVDLPPDTTKTNDVVFRATFNDGVLPIFIVCTMWGFYTPTITWDGTTLTYTRAYIDLAGANVIFTMPPDSFSYEEITQ